MSPVIRGVCFALAFLNISIAVSAQKRKDYTPLVDPFIGTSGAGKTFPGAVLPYGMARLNPQTQPNGGGYNFTDEYIYGFSQTGYNVSADSVVNEIIFMPTTGDITFKDADYRSKYAKKTEKASPGYYKVRLDKYEIGVELAAASHSGMQVFDYPSTTQANILIDLQGGTVESAQIEVLSNHEIKGYRKVNVNGSIRQVYFYSKFSKAFKTYSIRADEVMLSGKEKAEGKNIRMVVQFDNPNEVVVNTGLSHVSTDNALKNLNAEIPGFDIDKVQKATKIAWNAELSKIYVEGGAPPLPARETQSPSISNPYNHSSAKGPALPDYAQMKLVNFYSALYRTMLNPTIASDVDGQYRDGNNTASAKGFTYYDVSTLYNQFSQHYQLITLIDSTRTVDFIKSYLVNPSADSTATFAAWVAGAYARGIKGFDAEAAYNMLKNQLDKNESAGKFRTNGYADAKEEGAAAKTLVYAYNYFSLAQLAKLLNHDADYKTFIQYAQYWKNLYDPKSGFLVARQNGGWPATFNPAQKDPAYFNGNAWEYAFLVPHDAEMLVDYYGGKDAFEGKLDQYLIGDKSASEPEKSIGYYTGNGFNGIVPYLYNFTGAPQKAQLYINRIIRRFYQTDPNGLNANDVNAEVSAWYVLSSLGLYTMTPGQQQLHIGFPQFEKIIIKLSSEKTFNITNAGAAISNNNTYIQGMNFNKSGYNKLFLNYIDVLKGGEFEVFTGTMPNKLFMQDLEKLPLKITDDLIVPKPYILTTKQSVEIGCAEQGTTIYYTTDGSAPATTSKIYSKPFAVSANTVVKAIAVKNGTTSLVEQATIGK
ncbi:hypothetical protein EOD41_11485 [Mucilaginibacter limnophilus]|uniref:Glycoside hydrolase family 92 protein n=1 Tax=Mucilaginibacter limnophilus TaxID=1932778 RepID=A0A3S2VM94_9SPHI|nr:glycoside hydrolase domain-containing protein [Mucilaginibacter limnophilus]RVU00617.1 hypothetical protein EOD41_11485 [Mucilaginibacter limnophilus]